jgi:hypothetical protein
MSKIKLGKTGIDFIKEWVIKTALKQQPKGVLTTLPEKNFVDLNTSITAERLMRNGVDPNSIKNVDQVDNIIDQLNKPRVIAADSSKGKGITEALFGKKGEVFNLQGEKLDPNLPIVGGTQQGKKINRKFFERDAEGRDDIRKGIAKEVQQRIDSGVASTVEKMLRMDPIDAMKEANRVIKREGPYKNLSEQDAKKILQDTEDHIFERNIKPKETDMDFNEGATDEVTKAYNDAVKKGKFKGTEEDFRNKIDDMMDEDFAIGGRVGFFMGSKLPKGLAALREMLNFMSKQSDKVKNPSEVLKMVNPKSLNVSLEDPRLQGKVNKEGILASDIIKNFQSKMGEDRVQLVKDMLSAAKNIKKADTSQIKLKNEMIEDMIKKGVDREMAEEMATTMSGLARNMAGKVKDTPKLTDEGILELENILKNMETGGKQKRDLNADGGRIGFKKGMDRRTFMKAMAGLTTIPVFGKFFKGAEVAAPVVEKAAEVVSGAPPYFFNLVNRIRALGKKFDGPKERTESYKYKDYEMQIDNDTGQIEISKQKLGYDDRIGEGVVSEEYMSLKPGRADETTGGKKVADEYEENTGYTDKDGKLKDVESGVSEETVMDGSISKEELEQEIVEQLSKEAPSIKKASGGIARMLGE